MLNRFRFAIAPLAALAMFLGAHAASAATCTFASVGTSDFNTSANWSCGNVPTSLDVVIIPAATSTSLSATSNVNNLLISSGSTLTTTGFDLNIYGNAHTSGTLIGGGGNTITFALDWDLTGDGVTGGTFVPGNGTVAFGVIATGNSNSVFLNNGATLTFNNLNEDTGGGGVSIAGTSSASMHANGTVHVLNGYLAIGGNGLSVDGTTTIDGSGELDFADNTTNVFTGTLTNGGVILFGANALTTFNGSVVNTGTIQPSLGGSGTMTFGSTWTNSGTFTSGSSTVVFAGSAPQTVPSGLSFWNLVASSTGSTVTLGGNVTTTNNLFVAAGTFVTGANTVHLGGSFTRAAGTTETATPGFLLDVNGTGAQSLGSSGNPIDLASLQINKPSGTVTAVDIGTIAGNFALNSGTFNAGSDTIDISSTGSNMSRGAGATFLPGTSTLRFLRAYSILSVFTFNNLYFDGTTNASLIFAASSTIAGTLTQNSVASRISLLSNVELGVTGAITNNALITQASGAKIIHAAESAGFTTSGGSPVSAYTSPSTVYVQVQDGNRNISGTTTESFTQNVSMNAGAGSDAEVLTMTETGPATGIFRSNGVTLVSSNVSSPGNSQFEITGAGSMSATYTDNQDSSDVKVGSATVAQGSSGGSGSGSSGGGGLSAGSGSSGGSSSTTTSTGTNTTSTIALYQTYLANLSNLGIAVHGLVKLPDDGDSTTQQDTAVYYIGGDGMRHAFSNSKVFFSWYCDFSNVQVVQPSVLATIPLGKNVDYRPGVRMVKFTTDPKVYVVTKGGILRWVPTEDLAKAFYGDTWNTKIDDISDAFYGDYTFGAQISTSADFTPSSATQAVQYPSDSMSIVGYSVSTGTYGFNCPAPKTDAQKDTDNDTLNDSYERQIGTSPSNVDTDGDGLKDGEEVNIYHSNPLKADTDSDTYIDWQEVVTGHDPLGSGMCTTDRCILPDLGLGKVQQ